MLQQFCCKSVPFFHTKRRKFPFFIHPRMRAMRFLLAKYIPMSRKNGNGDSLLLVLEATSYQTKIFRHVSNLFAKLQHVKAPGSWFQACWVCLCTTMMVESVSWHVTSWNMCSLPTCSRSTVQTGENTAAINNKALSMLRPEHQSYFLKCIKSTMKILHHGWNICYPTKEKNLLTMIFKCTMGIYTHIDDAVSRDKHGICDWALLPLCVLSLIHIWRCRRGAECRSRWSPYH